eukprot:TRINITY_DN7991_c0_g1_i1.p1 TRINITY_DN7991_c0_g1~~TRINITY_DN7991_c0_g1_i1.p1  ORF type:complete len:766 (+),score=183.09 TRINITY_DN7991_c0_g1_i1:99-2396(+)
MISIEPKRTEKVDFVSPFKDYITKNYGKSEVAHHLPAIQTLTGLRVTALQTAAGPDILRGHLLRYHRWLDFIEGRFPIASNQIKVNFVWYDAFKPAKKCLMRSIHFERACVQFNLASVLCQVGALENRATSDGLKEAAKTFQLSAGLFRTIRDNAAQYTCKDLTVDMNGEILGALEHLMLAQAQECFFTKGMGSGLSPGVLSKLAMGAVKLYQQAAQELSLPIAKTTVDKSWASYCLYKARFFQAQAHICMANTAKEKDQYGMEVARLYVSSSMLDEAAKIGQGNAFFAAMASSHSTTRSTAVKRLQDAVKDNDTIYHEPIPPYERLEAIEEKVLVKSLPLSDVPFPNEDDPFFKLTPLAVNEGLKIYKSKIDELMLTQRKTFEERATGVTAKVAELNLSATLEAIDSKQPGIPAGMKRGVASCREKGGINALYQAAETKQNLAEEARSILSRIERTLQEEQDEDETMRRQFGNRWQRTPSHLLTVNLRNDLGKHRSHLEQAVKADTIVQTKLHENIEMMSKFDLSDAELDEMLPTASFSPQCMELVASMRSDTEKLEAHQQEASTLLDDLQKTAEADDATLALMNKGGKAQSQVIGEELQKYDPFIEKIANSFVEQGMLLQELEAKNNQIKSLQAADGASGMRVEFLSSLERAVKVFSDVQSNLREGVTFYKSFLDILKPFEQQAADLVFARRTEKADLLAQLQRDLAGLPPDPGMGPTAPAPAYGGGDGGTASAPAYPQQGIPFGYPSGPPPVPPKPRPPGYP